MPPITLKIISANRSNINIPPNEEIPKVFPKTIHALPIIKPSVGTRRNKASNTNKTKINKNKVFPKPLKNKPIIYFPLTLQPASSDVQKHTYN